jgi:hypothetical protein
MAEKINCREFIKCGRVTGETLINVPGNGLKIKDATPYGLNGCKKGYRIFRNVSGIFSEGTKGVFATLRFYCIHCDFFKPGRREAGFTGISSLDPHQRLQ